MENEARGRDVSAPFTKITLDGQPYKLLFNNNSIRIAEDVYEQCFGKDIGYFAIIEEMQRNKYRAFMAVFFSAMVAGGAQITWEEFDAKFKLDSVDSVRDLIAAGINRMLPENKVKDKANP